MTPSRSRDWSLLPGGRAAVRKCDLQLLSMMMQGLASVKIKNKGVFTRVYIPLVDLDLLVISINAYYECLHATLVR